MVIDYIVGVENSILFLQTGWHMKRDHTFDSGYIMYYDELSFFPRERRLEQKDGDGNNWNMKSDHL